MRHDAEPWPVEDRFLELRSPWLTLLGEHLRSQTGERLEYWRIEKANSIIVIPIQANTIWLPSPLYRPGVGEGTLDFPGGRWPAGQSSKATAIAILQRELGIEPSEIRTLTALNHQGWAVNSSFSNQRLYGYVAVLQADAEILQERDRVLMQYSLTASGIEALLADLTCLQCRAVLLEWLRQEGR